jgi:hypothetical protein
MVVMKIISSKLTSSIRSFSQPKVRDSICWVAPEQVNVFQECLLCSFNPAPSSLLRLRTVFLSPFFMKNINPRAFPNGITMLIHPLRSRSISFPHVSFSHPQMSRWLCLN